jgi:EAL domain-containing protein (putative c-di-GMP-specific phosphodiesterase class I)/AmiR/NasT family two-component response regulator
MKYPTPVKGDPATPAEAHGAGAALVLVAGGSDASRRLVVATLEADGHRVVEAADARRAGRVVSSTPVDLVVLGAGSTGDHVEEAVGDVRRSPFGSTVPIVLFTPAGDLSTPAIALEAGADDYLVEPFEAGELAARVRTRLRQSRTLRVLVDRRARERAVLQAIVQDATRAADLNGAADAVCHGLRTLPDVAGAAVVGFMPAGAEVFGAVGIPTLRTGDVLNHQLSAYLTRAAANGPWTAGCDGDLEAPRLTTSAVACAPIVERRTAGVLLLDTGIAGAPARSAIDILAVAIDAASLAGALLDRFVREHHQRVVGRASIESLLANGAFVTWYQPIVDLRTGREVGVEALTRFDDGTPPDVRFQQAAALDLGAPLELAALERALDCAGELPDDNFVSVNLSPETVLDSPALPDVLARSAHDVVIELSEHAAVDDYDALRDALVPCTRVASLSVDDAGSGFASLHHILQLHPEYVKLDRSWVHGVDLDPARQALIAGLGHFAQRTGARLVAEGIELPAEHDALVDLGVELGQGYLLGRPAPPAPAAESEGAA